MASGPSRPSNPSGAGGSGEDVTAVVRSARSRSSSCSAASSCVANGSRRVTTRWAGPMEAGVHFTADWVNMKINGPAQRVVTLRDPFATHDA
jgi:hypothetical protein